MFYKLLLNTLLIFCLISGLIMILPGNILLNIQPKTFRTILPINLDKFNSIDNINVEQFVKIETKNGPESLAVFKDKVVTGSIDGTIYEVLENTVKPLTRIITDGKRSPQILGLQFDSNGVLYATLCSYGIYRIENLFTNNPKISCIFNIEQTAALGDASKFLDDLAIEEKSNGDIILYITDVSTKFDINQISLIVLGSDYTGRILRYDVNNQRLEIIADNLFFPNGIQIMDNKRALLFSEFVNRTIWKYTFKGAKANNLELLMYNLPAEIDNIRLSASGQTYWLAMQTPRSQQKPTELDYVMKKPLLRKLILRSSHLIGSLLDYINMFIKNAFITELVYNLKNFNFVEFESGGMILEIDGNGNILNSIYSEKEKISHLSEVRELKSNQSNQRILLLGSYKLPFVRKMIISN